MAASINPWADNVAGVVIPRAGHFIPDERSDAVVDALTAFIDPERVAQCGHHHQNVDTLAARCRRVNRSGQQMG